MHIIIISSTPYTTLVFVWVAGERPAMGAWSPNGPALVRWPSSGTLPVLPQERLAVHNSLVTNILAVVERCLAVVLSPGGVGGLRQGACAGLVWTRG